MRLCYNSLLITIKTFYDKELELTDINDMLYRSIDDSFGRTCKSEPKENRQKYASELKSGKCDIPKEMKQNAKDKTWQDIQAGVKTHCKALLSLKDNDSLINVLNQLILQSNNISTEDIVFENPDIKKINFALVKMPIDEYLAKLLRYIFVNAIPVSKVKKTGFDSCHTFTEAQYDQIYSSACKATSPTIDLSSLITFEGESDFNKAFHQVIHPTKLSSKEPNDIRLFYLDTDSNGLNYDALKNCVATNLGNYIYSKKHNKELIDSKKYALIGIQALKDFRKSNVFNGDELGNILLYSFLETILKAPKIFSNFEIDKHRISSSNAIHIQTVTSSKIPYNMLVFGTSNIQDDFKTAVTKTIVRLSEIKKNEENHYSFINEAIFNASFDYVEAEKLKSIILPSEAKSSFAESGYAAFVGYKVNVNPDDYDNAQDYSNALQVKMRQDIIDNYNLIEELVVNNKLEKRSLYLYILPFNDPTKDKSEIINEIIEG